MQSQPANPDPKNSRTLEFLLSSFGEVNKTLQHAFHTIVGSFFFLLVITLNLNVEILHSLEKSALPPPEIRIEIPILGLKIFTFHIWLIFPVIMAGLGFWIHEILHKKFALLEILNGYHKGGDHQAKKINL